LRQAGYVVLSASTGKRGLEVLARLSRPPACIILDSAVQGPNSRTVLAQLSQLPTTAATPVLVIAPDSFMTAEPRVVRTLRKPVDEKMLPLIVSVAADTAQSLSPAPSSLAQQGALPEESDAVAGDAGVAARAEALALRGTGLRPVPATIGHALLLVRRPHTSLPELVGAIKADVRLTAGVLRLANSPTRARRRRVRTLAEAIVTLGLRELHLYLFTQWIASSLAQRLPAYGMAEEVLLGHALWTAVLSRVIVSHLGLTTAASDAYLSGLLHDCGKVVLNAAWSEHAPSPPAALLARGGAEGVAAERAALGVDHVAVSSALARRWAVDGTTATLIAGHHRVPDEGRADPVLLALCLANHLAPPSRPASAIYVKALGLQDDIGGLIDEAGGAVADFAATLMAGGRSQSAG
jgi:HD-like signal output (HDOD) protein